MKTNLGRVGLVPRGEYDAKASYRRLDVVTREGSAYVALCDAQGIAPGADGEVPVWQLLAKKGDKGDAGPVGPQGPKGEPGMVAGIPYSDSAPAALGEASPGVSVEVSRADHVHPTPTAQEVGARPDSWTPTAEEINALSKDGTAKDSKMLGGLTLAQLLLKMYPIGSIYISAKETNPAELYGGSWEELTGVYLRARDEEHVAGEVFGSDEHSHGAGSLGARVVMAAGGSLRIEQISSSSWKPGRAMSGSNYATDVSESTSCAVVQGSTETVCSMPSSLSVYMWKRIA